MSSYYRRHIRMLQVASALYLLPCSYNQRTEQFEETVLNRLLFAANVMMAVPFWVVDVILMSKEYLNHISPIMVIVGGIEITVYVSIVTCTLLNGFARRHRITRTMNVLFRSDWLLDRYGWVEQRYDNRGKFAATMLVMLVMVCCNMSYHQNINTRVLSLSVAMKIVGVCYLSFVHRIFVGAIGVRMEQLRELFLESQGRRAAREQTLHYFVDGFELYAAQVRQVNLCFSFPLMLILLLVVLEMVYLSFDCFTILQLRRPVLEGFDSGYTQWFLRQIWQCIYMAVVLLIVSGCEQTHSKLEETALCARHFDAQRYGHTRVAKHIRRFLLLNLERQMRFSVSGFFDIDYAMIHMVVSAIIAHTVILIQFDELQSANGMYWKKINSTV